MGAKGILERLSEGVVLGDGGYIVELEQRGYVVTGAFTPELAITHPGAIRELHREMRNAGCEVLQVMAFYGSREKLNTVGHGDRVLEINRARHRHRPGGGRRRDAGCGRPEHNVEVGT